MEPSCWNVEVCRVMLGQERSKECSVLGCTYSRGFIAGYNVNSSSMQFINDESILSRLVPFASTYVSEHEVACMRQRLICRQ